MADPREKFEEQIENELLLTLLATNQRLLTTQHQMEHKLMALSDQIKELQDAQAKLDQDVGNVQDVVAALKTNVDDLTKLVADLQANGATPENLAALQTIADDLNTQDAALDAVAPDKVTPPTAAKV